MCYYLFGGGIGFRVFYRGLPIGRRKGSLTSQEGLARLLWDWHWAGGSGRGAPPGSPDRQHCRFWGAEG